jgi:hypothetical protein
LSHTRLIVLTSLQPLQEQSYQCGDDGDRAYCKAWQGLVFSFIFSGCFVLITQLLHQDVGAKEQVIPKTWE